jgi:hypothetical protein
MHEQTKRQNSWWTRAKWLAQRTPTGPTVRRCVHGWMITHTNDRAVVVSTHCQTCCAQEAK